jgi:DNA-binding MurR/RpiR family transcriptional regulator
VQRINSLTKIKSLYPDMTQTDQQIADYILNNSEEVFKITIQTLAEKTMVSLPSVNRFAKRLGFKGFKDFKIELIKDIGVSFYISPEGMDVESVEGVTRNVFEKQILNLQETLANIDYDGIRSCVDAVVQAKRLLFFAVSSSIPVSLDFSWKFSLAGFTCLYNPDVYTQKVNAIQSRRSDVAFGISFSGESGEVVDSLRIAQENGAKTICVTTFIESSITAYADIKLFTAPVSAHYQKIDLPSKLAQTAIMDVLYLLVVMRNREQYSKVISRSEEELLKHRKK